MPETVNQTPKSGHHNGPSGNSLMQITSGPSALAALMIYKILSMYNKITALDSEQQQNMVSAQKSEANSQAKELRSGGSALLTAAEVAGGIAIGGALIGFGISKGLGSDDDMGEANGELKGVEGEMGTMQGVETIASAPADEEVNIGEGVYNPSNAEIDARVTELGDGTYEMPQRDGESDFSYEKRKTAVTQGAVTHMKQLEADPLTDDTSYTDFKEKLDERMETNKKLQAAKSTKMSTMQQKRTNTSNVFSPVFQTGSSVANASGQQAQSIHQGASGLYGSANQMAGTESGSYGQAMGKASDAANTADQTLQQIARSRQIQG